MRSFFVAGSDTGIAMTGVTCRLVGALEATGQRVAPMKPIASGAGRTAAGCRHGGALALLAATALELPYDDVNPYCLESPVAPWRAFAEAGIAPDLERILEAFERLRARADRVVVEGVGGWLEPLDGDRLQPDLVRALGLPVVLVVGLRPGCVNHALLSVREILGRGFQLAGWVAHPVAPAPFARAEATAMLERLIPVPRIDPGHPRVLGLGLPR